MEKEGFIDELASSWVAEWKKWVKKWMAEFMNKRWLKEEATSCEEPTHWKRPLCWEILKAGGKGDNTGWHGWMVSPTQWTWVWANSGR